jgi:hypothetical protein
VHVSAHSAVFARAQRIPESASSAQRHDTQCLQGVRITITTGASHAVDSSDVAFRLAAVGAFRQAYAKAGPVVLEPQMQVRRRLTYALAPYRMYALQRLPQCCL